jgi:hypothetical protein
VKREFHARFWIGGGESNLLADHTSVVIIVCVCYCRLLNIERTFYVNARIS